MVIVAPMTKSKAAQKPSLSHKRSLTGAAILGAGSLSTLAINPVSAYDPINLPKLFVLSTLSIPLISYILLRRKLLLHFKTVTTLVSLLILFLFITPLYTEAPFGNQFWGVFGRSTGILAYLSYLILFTATLLWIAEDSQRIKTLVKVFERTSFFITVYVIIQYADLDPIAWSQKQPFATLGNINFMSAFLGMANSLFIGRLFFNQLAVLSKFFYILILAVNSLLIWESGSIQGLGMIFVAFSLNLVIYSMRKRKVFVAAATAFLATTTSIVLALGSAGYGFAGKFLFQETVLYRIDYWKAGLSMFAKNVFTGVGIDSYGSYYRTYRDLLAATRTGPQRTTNTAHNVFIDLLAGGGLFVGIIFMLIVALTVFSSIKFALSRQVENEVLSFPALNIAFVVFLLISIGQIGVVVWGFIFFGASLGAQISAKSPDIIPNSGKRLGVKNSTDEPKNLVNNSRSGYFIFLSLILFVAGLIFGAIPNYADSRFFSAIKAESVDGMKRAMSLPGATEFHEEQYLEYLVEGRDDVEASEFAVELIERYPRNFYAYSIIFFSASSSDGEKEMARAAMLRLDPNNLELQKLAE